MELETLSCNNCGAPLDVPLAANYVTCAHCGSRLVVQRSASVHYTEVLERLEQLDSRTHNVETELLVIRLEKAIEELDDSWRVQSRKFAAIDKNGSASMPASGDFYYYIVLAIIAVVASPFVFAYASSAMPPFLPVIVILFILLLIISIWGAIQTNRRYKAYVGFEARYKAERTSLVNEWRRAKSEITPGNREEIVAQ
jgi:DNA-directed RNA polymerase subunit RPC12/RpoP